MVRLLLRQIKTATVEKKRRPVRIKSMMKTQSKVKRWVDRGLRIMVPKEVTRSRKVWISICTNQMTKNVQNLLLPDILVNNQAKRRETGTTRRIELVNPRWCRKTNSVPKNPPTRLSASGKREARTPAITPNLPVSLVKPVLETMYPAKPWVTVSMQKNIMLHRGRFQSCPEN